MTLPCVPAFETEIPEAGQLRRQRPVWPDGRHRWLWSAVLGVLGAWSRRGLALSNAAADNCHHAVALITSPHNRDGAEFLGFRAECALCGSVAYGRRHPRAALVELAGGASQWQPAGPRPVDTHTQGWRWKRIDRRP